MFFNAANRGREPLSELEDSRDSLLLEVGVLAVKNPGIQLGLGAGSYLPDFVAAVAPYLIQPREEVNPEFDQRHREKIGEESSVC